jgi:hypothetical protein
VLGARKKSERETRKLRCAKPSAPKASRRRMKPILDRTKSKAEAYAPGAAPKDTFPLHSVLAFFSWNFRDCLLWKALRQSAAVRCALGLERSLLPTAFCPLWVSSGHSAMFNPCGRLKKVPLEIREPNARWCLEPFFVYDGYCGVVACTCTCLCGALPQYITVPQTALQLLTLQHILAVRHKSLHIQVLRRRNPLCRRRFPNNPHARGMDAGGR